MYGDDSEATYYPPPISQTGNKNYEWILTNLVKNDNRFN